MSVNDSFSFKLLETTSAKCKADKVKGGRPKMLIWNDFIEGEDDRHRHFRAICAFCDKEKWQRGKPSTMEAHLALHCKGLVPDDIRRRWLIEGDSLYNFIITTPNCYEYLYALADYSEEHQTENFIANKISDIIEKIASRLLHVTISSMNIKGGSLETYSETRWVSIYDTTNSIVHVRPAIDKILEEKPDIFTNQEVFKIVCNEDDIFYMSCKRISLIFEPIKRVINLLESHTASLADCFMEIVQIAIALKKIPTSNNFRTLAITVFNFCYQQLDIFPYILTYFLYPNYRNQGLKKGKFLEICKMATEYYKEAHRNDKECRRLMSQLIKYKARDAVEDEHTDLQELAKTMFAIIPSQANYKQNFSILKWFTKGCCTRLQVPRLKSIAQLHSYYISNVEKELKLRDDFAEIELRNSALNETIFAEIDNLEPNKYEEEDKMNTEDLAVNDITMALQDLVDLSDPIFGVDNNQEEPIFTDKETSMEFDSRSLVQDMLSD
ncbi:43821_t:CDS:2, partial [Gigaspora margarita]